MTDWSPTGAPYAISARASASAQLERAYRRLVGCYPRSFRSENTEEIIAVLLATAREGQRRPSLLEVADLLRGAARMRLGLTGCPQTVLHAVRLMYLGALAQVAVLVTVLLSIGRVEAFARAAAARTLGAHPDPVIAQQTVARAAEVATTDLTADVGAALFAIVAWIFFAWGNRKGIPHARSGAIIVCAGYAAVTAMGLAKGDMAIAPAAVIASVIVMAIGVTVNILLVMKQSWPYYARRSVAR
jgi:hypothetical protein